MTDHKTSNSPTGCCQHYPNRVLRKRDLALELGTCEKTIGNLLDAGKLPEPCWMNSIPVWPRSAVSDHPVLGPTLLSLRAGDARAVRSALVSAMTGKTAGSYAALLVQLAYAAVHLVPDISDRLPARGVAIAVDPDAAARRPAGNGN